MLLLGAQELVLSQSRLTKGPLETGAEQAR